MKKLSIIRSKNPTGYGREIIVVDAKSSDITPKILKRFKKWIKVIYDEGKGIGIARNIGVLTSSGDIICFVDADAIVSHDHFIKIIKAFEKGNYDVLDVLGIPSEPVFKRWPIVAQLEYLVRLHGRAYKINGKRHFAAGCFVSFKKNVFYKVNGFWTYPPFGADDIDFAYRVAKKGFKIGVVRIYGSYSLPRTNIIDMIKQQYSWGKGFAYFISKFRHDPYIMKAYRFKPIIRNIVLYFVLRLMFAPLGSIRLFLSVKKLSIIPYWIVRRLLFFLGFILSLRKALGHYSSGKK